MLILRHYASILWDFSRPHTIIGTFATVLFFYLFTWIDVQKQVGLVSLLGTFVASIAVNIYIVGLNQITDIEIDRVNKPYLPLANARLTSAQAYGIVLIAGVISLLMALMLNVVFFLAIALIFIIGTIYSLPPLRLKRFPLYSALCIVLARGVIGNIGVYSSYQIEVNRTPQFTPYVVLFIGTMTLFSVVISIMKDSSDTDGDRQYGIYTLAVRLGTTKIHNLYKFMMIGLYGLLILIGLFYLKTLLVSFLHALALIFFLTQAKLPRTTSQEEITANYRLLWRLFYLEFIIFFAGIFVERYGV